MPPEGGFFFPPLSSPTAGYVMFGSNYPAGNTGVVGSDLMNAGDDYAIRVQQFDADVKGNITENLSWRIGFWGMKKEGTRQANTQQHCSAYNARRYPPRRLQVPCHDPGTKHRLADRASRAGNCLEDRLVLGGIFAHHAVVPAG